MAEEKLKIAVFVDFDNIEIGVKTTLNRMFDIGVVLEAIKERGEVVTKIAYGDWKRAGDHSRGMSQHAIQMVQRNLTPGGDKNGADINLALDALEMAFTRNHINTFVIVGGDSDFMALVEKLKQYDKKVFIVGGRSFTSIILQKNCHEFIAYENLIAPRRSPTDKGRPVAGGADITKAAPLVRRALKVLSDREVSPQLGLLKSTLLQLDSTFTERDYGASTFRDFIEKMAKAGQVTLKQVDRSLLVELKDGDGGADEPVSTPTNGEAAAIDAAAAPEAATPASPVTAPPPAAPMNGPQHEEGVKVMQDIFATAKYPPKWPMYLRNVKQFLRSVQADFDERRFGFSTIHDLVRQGQKIGMFRLERNRQGILRVFPGANLKMAAPITGIDLPQPDIMDVMMDTAAPEAQPPVMTIEESAPEPIAVPPVELSADAALDAQFPNGNVLEPPRPAEPAKRRRRTGSAPAPAGPRKRRAPARKTKATDESA